MQDVIAHKELIGIWPNGEQIRITLRIGRPYLNNDTPPTWACPVALEPQFGRLSDIKGEDSFQALCLASHFVLTPVACLSTSSTSF